MLSAGRVLEVEAEVLRHSLQERPNVDVAKGMLMAMFRYSEAEAFAELCRVAGQEGISLYSLAAALVELVSGADSVAGSTEPATVAAHRHWGTTATA